jgi:hypothetical protein
MTSEQFREWLREPLPTWDEPPCDTCGEPTAVTLTVDGKTLRACEQHVSTLTA